MPRRVEGERFGRQRLGGLRTSGQPEPFVTAGVREAPTDETDSDTRVTRSTRWIEIVTAGLLAVATIGSAWSAYQATRWGGIQAIKASDASAARVESTRASTLGGQLTQIDAASFYPWLDAFLSDDEERATFYFERFRADFQLAVEAWLAAEPLRSDRAPLVPFQLSEYKLSELTESQRLADQAQVRAQESRWANQRSDNYVLAVVFFASVLFFAGVATKFRTTPAQLATVAVGAVLFVATASWIATLPASVDV